MRMPQQEPSEEPLLVTEEVVVETTVPIMRQDERAMPIERRDETGVPGYTEWDRTEWVGEGQEPPDSPELPLPAPTEPRWTKWEWIGEGQGEPGPRRGLPAEAMPEGENDFGGHRHNPGMAHWAGRRF